MLGENSSSNCNFGASAKNYMSIVLEEMILDKNIVMGIKRGPISEFAYRASMFSSGRVLAADYSVVISLCVKVVHICLLSHHLDLGTVRKEQSGQEEASTMKRRVQCFVKHCHLNGLGQLLSQIDRCYWGGSVREEGRMKDEACLLK